MTIYYNQEIATCTGFGSFLKLLLRWRGSIYKVIWIDLLFFMLFYYLCDFIYHNLLDEAQKKTFAFFVKYCNNHIGMIPLIFVLGCFVRVVMARWWEQYMNIPNPDSTAIYVSAFLHGSDVRSRVMRRTIMRYVCLCLTMVFRDVSIKVKKRFPTSSHYINAGFLTVEEWEILKAFEDKFQSHSHHFMPIIWAAGIAANARKEGRIHDAHSLKTIIDAMNNFRTKCMLFLYYSFVPIPLIYMQVVSLAVYVFLLCSIFGKQEIGPDNHVFDYVRRFVPLKLILEFCTYAGWLTVAETLANPWGEDDEDFEVNWLIDRNLKVSYMIVDEMYNTFPDLVKDLYWDNIIPDMDENAEGPPLPSTFYVATDVAPKTTMPDEPSKSDILDGMSGVTFRRFSRKETLMPRDQKPRPETHNIEKEEKVEDAFEQLRQQRALRRRARKDKSIADALKNI